MGVNAIGKFLSKNYQELSSQRSMFHIFRIEEIPPQALGLYRGAKQPLLSNMKTVQNIILSLSLYVKDPPPPPSPAQ